MEVIIVLDYLMISLFNNTKQILIIWIQFGKDMSQKWKLQIKWSKLSISKSSSYSSLNTYFLCDISIIYNQFLFLFVGNNTWLVN